MLDELGSLGLGSLPPWVRLAEGADANVYTLCVAQSAGWWCVQIDGMVPRPDPSASGPAAVGLADPGLVPAPVARARALISSWDAPGEAWSPATMEVAISEVDPDRLPAWARELPSAPWPASLPALDFAAAARGQRWHTVGAADAERLRAYLEHSDVYLVVVDGRSYSVGTPRPVFPDASTIDAVDRAFHELLGRPAAARTEPPEE